MPCKCHAPQEDELWPDYISSEILEVDALRHTTTLALAAGVVRPLESLSLVKRQLIFNVRYGEAHVWFLPEGKPYIDGDEPHLIIAPDTHPFVLTLPPGRHKLNVGAGGSLALTAVVTFLDAEGR